MKQEPRDGEEKKETEAEEKKKKEDTWSHYELKLECDANYLEALKHDHIIPIMSYDLCSMVIGSFQHKSTEV